MSTIQDWVADLQRMPTLSDDRFAHWQPFRHACACRTLDAETLSEALRQLGPVSGWLSETGRIVELERQSVEPIQRPLAGEFFRDGHHWQLSAHPRGRWLLHHHTMSPCPADQATHLGERVTHLLAAPRRGWLEYWRLWAPDCEPDTRHDPGPTCRIALLTAIRKER